MMSIYKAERRECWRVRTFLVQASSPAEAAELAEKKWQYEVSRGMLGSFHAEDFRDVGQAFTYDESLLPDH